MSDKAAKTATIQALKGLEDILPVAAARYQHVENLSRQLFACYGYSEIRTPIIEPTELYHRSVGEASDVVVSKQMYTFTDPGDRSNTLRPEGTAAVVRALVEHGVFKELPAQKLYYIGPMFRYERPQKGRQRQFHQIGIEYFGVAHPAADVEVIGFCDMLLRQLGFTDIVTKVNNIGCRECRRAYNEQLRLAITQNNSPSEAEGGVAAAARAWCGQCLERARVNPMRVFDCKIAGCQELVAALPRVSDFVCEACRTHFDAVLQLLKTTGVPYELDSSLVRGFDYYSRTVFEVMQSNIGAQRAILGGGRYDYLVEELGGPPTPAVGMSIGFERLLLSMEASGLSVAEPPSPELFAVALDEQSLPAVFGIVQGARARGQRVAFDCQPRTAKAGLKAANRLKAQAAIIIGSNELARNVAQRKDLTTGEQVEIPLSQL